MRMPSKYIAFVTLAVSMLLCLGGCAVNPFEEKPVQTDSLTGDAENACELSITLDKDSRNRLSLSKTRDFSATANSLVCVQGNPMGNISAAELPTDLDAVDGEHNGVHYIAYTFYVKNTSDQATDIDRMISLQNVIPGVDQALRVRVYVNGSFTDYAYPSGDGSGAEPGTVTFHDTKTVCRERLSEVAPGDAVKFTVVVWIESGDPECMDGLSTETCKIVVQLSAVS